MTTENQSPDPAPPLSDGFDGWWAANRIKRVLNPAGVARMVWEASARHNRKTVLGATESTSGFYPEDEGSTPSGQANSQAPEGALREAARHVIAQRDRYGWSPEADAAINALRSVTACAYPRCPYPCPDLPDCRDAERTALAAPAPQAAQVPPGMVLVPVEPTPEMESECMGLLMSESLIYERQQGGLAVETIAPVKLWGAMLAAAPQTKEPKA